LKVWKEVGALRDHRCLAEFVHELIADLGCGEAMDQARERSELRVVLTGVRDTAEDVESRAVSLDGVPAETAAIDLAKIQILQSVGGKVRIHEAEKPGNNIAIVAHTAAIRVGSYTRGRRRKIVRGVNRRFIKRQLVMQSGADAIEAERQVFRLAVAGGQSESDGDSTVPSLQK